MNLFEEIDKYKQDLPKINNIANEVKRQKLNIYQIVACITMIISFFLGIILGNLFPSCGSTATLYGETSCTGTEFNISLTLFFWFSSFLLCLFFYGMGHIISLLTSIDKKLSKERQRKHKNHNNKEK